MRQHTANSVVRFAFLRILRIIAVVLVLSLLAQPSRAQQPPIRADAVAQINALLQEKAQRTPAQKKISSRLLLGIKKRQGDVLLNAVPALRTPIDVGVDRKTLVDIKAHV